MNKSLHLLKVRMEIHPFFFVFLFLALMTGQFLQILTLFAILLFHEWGHLFWARYFGWHVERIHLLPFGGLMEVSSPLLPDAREEAVVVLGGPFNNFILILLASFLNHTGWISSGWSRFMIEGNLVLALFNLLPLYPLDGGRLFQLLAALRLPYRVAILFTLYVGGGLLLIMLLLTQWGWTFSLSLWFIFPYLLFTLYREYRYLPYRFMKFLLMRYLYRKERTFPLQILPVPASRSLRKAAEGMYRYRYHLFQVKFHETGSPSRYLREERILDEIFGKKTPFLPIGKVEEEKEIPS
ncbi:MAG: hypothetical protein IMW85_09905 [Thermicanus sp.]|nr:hypothetical protein [Thermicanus sp.]